MRSEWRALVLGAAVMAVGCGKKPAPAVPVPEIPAPPSVENGGVGSGDMDEARRRAEQEARVTATLEQMVFFDYDRSDIRPDQRAALDAKVPLLRAQPQLRLRVEGHADERGSIEYNLALGMRRAEGVKQYLTMFDLSPVRFDTFSFGEESPLDRGRGEAAFARNRRAEFRLLGQPVAQNEGGSTGTR